MPRYIDADAFLARNAVYADREFDHPKYQETLREIVDKEPTISPDEVRGVGKWIDKGVRAWACSCCGVPLNHIRQFASFERDELPRFCPNCGAKMEVSEDA